MGLVNQMAAPVNCLFSCIPLAVALALLGVAGADAAPSTPANLVATVAPLNGQVGLVWSASAGATNYNVKRSLTAGGPYALAGSTAATSFTDTNVVAGTAYFYAVSAVDGTGESAAFNEISTTPVIVVDNSDATGVTIVGAWTAATGVPGFYGTNYLFDGNTGATGGKRVTFSPDLPVAGWYDVYGRWTTNANRASNTPFDIVSTQTTNTLSINQRTNSGWMLLGTFSFDAGTNGRVVIRNDGANGQVIADAVAFVRVGVPLADYSLVTFSDDFTAPVYSTNTWAIYDNRTNLTSSNGALHLNTILVGTNYTYGGLYTRTAQQRFGYYETRMQLARDDGLNNAFWLYTPFKNDNGVDKLEVDITEAHFHNESHMNVHDWKPTHLSTSATLPVPGIYPGFHTVGFEWARDNTLRWYWDGALVRTLAATSFNAFSNLTPMQVMFSTKVVPGFSGTPGPLLDGSSMDVDYVRVYQKPGWTGSSNGNWGTAANWGPDGVPANGDAAIFNVGSSNTTVALAADKAVKEIFFSTTNCPAYTFTSTNKLILGALAAGSGLGGILINGDVTNAQVFNLPVVASNTLALVNYSTNPGATLDLNSNLTSSATNRALLFGGDGRVNVRGALSSLFRNVTRYDDGITMLSASNAFTGVLDIQNGSVVITTNGALGATGSNAVTLATNGSLVLSGNVIYSANEELHLGGDGDTAGGRLGALDTANGTNFAFTGPIFCDTHATIANSVPGSLLTVTGLMDTDTNSYKLTFQAEGDIVATNVISGAGRIKIIGQGTVSLGTNNTFIGPTYAFPQTAVYPGGTLIVQGDGIFGAAPPTFNPINIENKGTLRIVSSFTLHTNRGISLGLNADYGEGIFEVLPGVTFTVPTPIANIGGQGDALTKAGAGTLVFGGTNTYTGPTTINAGTLVITGNELISGSSDLVLNDGTFDLNGFTETVGDVTLNSGSITNTGGSSAQYLSGTSYTVQSGQISARLGGSGALVKTGAGTATLSGASTFLGGSTVNDGTLVLTGSLNSLVTVAGGTLSGTGTVNSDVTVTSGGLAPGLSPGVLTVKSNFTLAAAGSLQIEINGTAPGTGYDQVKLTSASSVITLAGDLAITATNGLAINTTFVIVTNSGSAAVSGTFAGKPQGFTFFASGYWWRVSYTGGNGNDVTLTIVAPPATPLVTPTSVSNGFAQLTVTGDSNLAYQVQASTNLANPASWTTLLVTNSPTVPFNWTDTNAGSFIKRFYRVLLGP